MTYAWVDTKDKMPEVKENDAYEVRSNSVFILDKNRCVWLAYWDGEVWYNANSPDIIYLNKDSVTHWHPLPALPLKIKHPPFP